MNSQKYPQLKFVIDNIDHVLAKYIKNGNNVSKSEYFSPNSFAYKLDKMWFNENKTSLESIKLFYYAMEDVAKLAIYCINETSKEINKEEINIDFIINDYNSIMRTNIKHIEEIFYAELKSSDCDVPFLFLSPINKIIRYQSKLSNIISKSDELYTDVFNELCGHKNFKNR